MTAGSSNGWTNVEALGVPDPLHLGQRLADVGAVQDDPRAVAQAGLDLRPDRAGRHRRP